MNEELANKILQQMAAQTAVLSIIAEELSKIAQAAAPEEPAYRRPLSDYPKFNWDSIGAEILKQDGQGATMIQWGGKIWRRYSGTGKYGDAIWFSRSVGEREFIRLITFKDWQDEPEPLKFQPQQPGPARPDQPPRRDDRPMPQSQAVAAAQGESESRPDDNHQPASRENFYALAGESIKSGQVSADRVNEIVKAINQNGYEWGYAQLQAHQMSAA